MLTVRLKLNGVPSAFQTNRVVSLLTERNSEFTEVLSGISRERFSKLRPAQSMMDEKDLIESEFLQCIVQASVVTDVKSDQSIVGVGANLIQSDLVRTMVKLDNCRGEPGDLMGDTKYPNSARFICLSEGDSVHVLDSGSVLFKWPEQG